MTTKTVSTDPSSLPQDVASVGGAATSISSTSSSSVPPVPGAQPTSSTAISSTPATANGVTSAKAPSHERYVFLACRQQSQSFTNDSVFSPIVAIPISFGFTSTPVAPAAAPLQQPKPSGKLDCLFYHSHNPQFLAVATSHVQFSGPRRTRSTPPEQVFRVCCSSLM